LTSMSRVPPHVYVYLVYSLKNCYLNDLQTCEHGVERTENNASILVSPLNLGCKKISQQFRIIITVDCN
jgi:hypothetical protein